MLVIDRKNFLTSSHLVCKQSSFYWSDSIPHDSIFSQDLPVLAKIFGEDLDPMIPDSYRKSAEILNVSPPWCYYIGKNKFLKLVKSYTDEYYRIKSSFDENNLTIHNKVGWFLKQLKPCPYDVSLIDKDLINHFNKSVKDHIDPKSGTVCAPNYLRTKTKTGRLSVFKGPNVLNMHAGLRKGIIDGYSIDFVSMEPNLLLALQNRAPQINLYENIRSELFNNKISRAKVKIATMAALYGSDRNDKFAKQISEYFQLDNQVAKLEKSIKDDSIKNEYGRLIKLQGARGRHLLSLWLQSSASDAALYGFYNFYNDNDIIPHWIIHDGLIFIYNGNKNQVKNLDIGLNIKLPVKVEKL